MTHFTEMKTKSKPSLQMDIGGDSENIQNPLDYESLRIRRKLQPSAYIMHICSFYKYFHIILDLSISDNHPRTQVRATKLMAVSKLVVIMWKVSRLFLGSVDLFNYFCFCELNSVSFFLIFLLPLHKTLHIYFNAFVII